MKIINLYNMMDTKLCISKNILDKKINKLIKKYTLNNEESKIINAMILNDNKNLENNINRNTFIKENKLNVKCYYYDQIKDNSYFKYLTNDNISKLDIKIAKEYNFYWNIDNIKKNIIFSNYFHLNII